MQIRSLNALRVFDVVARLLSFSKAAQNLAMSQGAVSYRILRLEDELGFALFDRSARSVRLTAEGVELHLAVARLLHELDEVASRVRRRQRSELVLGVSTYFGSRWLSPRLMRFMLKHPEVKLRLQPMVAQPNLKDTDVDVAVVWGSHDTLGGDNELLLESSVTPMCGAAIEPQTEDRRDIDWLLNMTLIHEDETRDAWQKWLSYAGLNDQNARQGPVIPDPNMRVQALIDGQGLALLDELVSNEINQGLLVAPSNVSLSGFGYYIVVNEQSKGHPKVGALISWMQSEASGSM